MRILKEADVSENRDILLKLYENLLNKTNHRRSFTDNDLIYMSLNALMEFIVEALKRDS